MAVICTTHLECFVLRMKLYVFKLKAELSISIYASRWTDSHSKIGTVRKWVPKGVSVPIAELKDQVKFTTTILGSNVCAAHPFPPLAYRVTVLCTT